MKRYLTILLLLIVTVVTLSACSLSPTQETPPDETYEMTMLCSFSGGTTESRTSHVSGYSYGRGGGYVSGTAHYTVDAEHYYVVCETQGAYFLIDFGNNITTFMLAANQPTFDILATTDELFGTQYQYYYCTDKNPKQSKNRISISSLSEEEANIYIAAVMGDLGIDETSESTNESDVK